MQLNGIKRRGAEILGFIREHWLALSMIGVSVLLGINSFQRWQDRRAFERNAEQIRIFDAERQQKQRETQELFTVLNNQHQSTHNILAALKDVNGTITALIENDRRQDAAVTNLQQEYKNAKDPNPNDPNVSAARRARRALPVGERERRALAADRELYPAADGN